MMPAILNHKHPWYPMLAVLLCMFILTVSNGMVNSGMSVFDESMLNEFAWTVGQLKLRDSINFLGAAVFVVFAGYAVDRVGFKPPLLFGLACLSAVYFTYGFVQSLFQLYTLHVLLAVVLASAGNMVAIIAAASSMPDRRGLAVGITVAGTSVGGMLLPLIANYLNESIGWRMAMRVEALIPLSMFILVALLLKNKVSSKAQRGGGPDKSKAATSGLSFGQAVRSYQFYLIALAGAITFYSVLALYSHLFLYMRSLDYSTQTASLAIGFFSLSALFGKLGFGWLSDVVNPFFLLRMNMFFMLSGLAGIFYFADWLWVFLALTALGWGGLHTLYNYVLLKLFGMRAAGKIVSTVSVFQSAGAGIGAAATGFLFDLRGDYSVAFLVVVGLMALGFISTLFLKPIEAQLGDHANR